MLMKRDNLLILGYPMWNGQMWGEYWQYESYRLGIVHRLGKTVKEILLMVSV